MECERLNRLVRTWYVQVQEESLAPARMVEFMEMHLEGCDDCLADPDVRAEVKKITELVLPPSKMTKPVKSAKPKDEVPATPSETAENSTDDEHDHGDGDGDGENGDGENGDEEEGDSEVYDEAEDIPVSEE